MDAPKLFVCYASEDENIAARVSEALRADKGIDVWFSKWELLGGDPLVRKIEGGISSADCVAAFLSKHSIKKAWPTVEREAATVRMIEEGIRVIPLDLGVEPGDVPALLRGLVRIKVDAAAPNAVSKAVAEIAAAVYGDSGRPPLGQPPPFATAPVPETPSQFTLSRADRAVLGILFEMGIGEEFRVGFDSLKARAEEAGLDKEPLEDSLEILREASLVSFDRALFGGSINTIQVATTGAEICCLAVLPDYPDRKRRILAGVLSGTDPRMTDSDEVIERTGEEPWLVIHVLEYAELMGYLALRVMNPGYAYYVVHTISPRLKRLLQEPSSEI